MIRTQVLKHLPRARDGEKGRSKEDIRGVTTTREAKGKSRYVRVIERKEVRKDDPIEYFLPTGFGTTFRVPEGVMAIDVSQNKEISVGVKDGERKGIGSAICRRRAHSWSINTKE